MTSVAGAKPASEKSEQGDKDKDVSDTIAVEIIRCLGNQREKTEFSDVTVVVDGMEFKCHRVILAACSGFFDGLFASGMKEDIEGRVRLSDISKGTFTQVLECIYKGKNVLTESNIFEVWHAANILHIIFLLTECEKYLKDTISPDNCLAIYQQSKLLDSKTMINFSWDYILKHFDSLKVLDELLMLTAKEMLALVASPHLVTASEDRVIETILKWIEFDPDQEIRKFKAFFPTAESDKECQDLYGNVDVSSRDASVEQQPIIAKSSTAEEEDQGKVEKILEEESKPNEPKPQSEIRSAYLADLLKSSRICLVSGRCLMNTVWTNTRIQADPNALEIVQEAIEYQLETDRRHDYCPPTAIHRLSSNMETVIVALNTYSRAQDTIICRKQDGEWYVLAKRFRSNVTPHCCVCFDQNIFITDDNYDVHVYMTANRGYKELVSMSTYERILHLLSLGSFLYAVHDDENHSIEALNVKEVLAGQDDCRWVQVGTLSKNIQTISCTIVVGDKLIFLGHHAEKDDTIVECFDTSTLTNYRLDDIPGTSVYMVTFRKGKDAFALQRNGALWRINTCPTQPFVTISNETFLWDFNRDLTGAVLFNDELQLFGSSFPTKDADKIWELGVPGVFKRVRNVNFSGDFKCFMHTIIPKRSLLKKDV